jgi:predicted acyl esterase
MNQYYAASHQPPSPHLKAIIPWEGVSDMYRDISFWGGIPETNMSKRDVKAAIKNLPSDQARKMWAPAVDTVANQNIVWSYIQLLRQQQS